MSPSHEPRRTCGEPGAWPTGTPGSGSGPRKRTGRKTTSAPRADFAREIADIQAVLLTLAKDKTEQRYLATVPTALPDVRKGIRIKAS